MCVEMLIHAAGSLSIYAQSQNWCSKYVYEVYMYIAKNFCHEGVTVSPFYLLLCSGGDLATTVRSAPVVSLHNATLATANSENMLPQKTKWIFLKKNHRTLTRLDQGSARGIIVSRSDGEYCLRLYSFKSVLDTECSRAFVLDYWRYCG